MIITRHNSAVVILNMQAVTKETGQGRNRGKEAQVDLVLEDLETRGLRTQELNHKN